MRTASPSTRERDLFANRLVAVLLAIMVVGLLVFGMAGCAATAHAMNLVTQDDFHGYVQDQEEFHRAQTESEADMALGAKTPAQHVETVAAALKKASTAFHTRTPDPVPGGGPDWDALTKIVVGGVVAIALARANINAGKAQVSADTAHAKTVSLEKSIAETDQWVDETEKKAHANEIAIAVTNAARPTQPGSA